MNNEEVVYGTIALTDIVGSTSIANSYNDVSRYYKDFLGVFHDSALLADKFISRSHLANDKNRFKVEIRGDEVISIYFFPQDKTTNLDKDKSKGVLFSIDFSLALRLYWLVLDGVKRIKNIESPVNLATGIHCGLLYYRKVDGNEYFEGNPFNIAKRIESSSRNDSVSSLLCISSTIKSIIDAGIKYHITSGDYIDKLLMLLSKHYKFSQCIKPDAKGVSNPPFSCEITGITDESMKLIETDKRRIKDFIKWREVLEEYKGKDYLKTNNIVEIIKQRDTNTSPEGEWLNFMIKLLSMISDL